MTTQIQVVDINDNANDNIDEAPVEDIKPEEVKPKSKPRAKAKAKAEVHEEVKPKAKPKAKVKIDEEVKEEIKEEVEEEERMQEEVKQEEVKQEEVKPKERNRPELKEKANCLDCGKEVTMHGLQCTHKRYCKASQPELQPTPMPKLERTATLGNIARLYRLMNELPHLY